MTDFDAGEIFYSDQGHDNPGTSNSPAHALIQFREFLRQFRINEDFVYRDMLRAAIGMKQYAIDVDIDHLMEFDDKLTNELLLRPALNLPTFEKAALRAAVLMAFTTEAAIEDERISIQVTLTSSKQPITIREMLASQVSRVVTIPGIIIAASRVKAKATAIFAMCTQCSHVKKVPVRAGFAGANLPRVCDRERQPNEAQCPLDSFQIQPEKCEYVDQQTWKLQESPEMVPTGEMPRSITMSVDRRLVDRANPGTRVTVTGIMQIMTQQGKGNSGTSAKDATRTPYLQVLGLRHGFEQRTAENESLTEFSQAEEEEFMELSRDPRLLERLTKSIAPSIFGSEDVKKAVSCLLFSGSRKELNDGARLRGDINVLLLGDPSVAKSQFLKFVEKAAPVAVYTSGKGSSAAGLTATVTQDAGSREFYLEGGAMVIADGGVVCIDEFDKMRESDRVAIHEAMEQQTISIAKAGITTVLNSRTAVLAAANPAFGRYQDDMNAAEQVDFQSTILSRFDMIFILKDRVDDVFDERLARHIIGIHVQGASVVERPPDEDELSVNKLKRYVSYARKTCKPRLSEGAAEALSNHYVQIRQGISEADASAEKKGKAPRMVPITVRQLEAIVRISESFAKMRLSEIATEDDVNMAMQLFSASTLQAAKMGEIELEGGTGEGEQTAVTQIEQRISINSFIGRKKLVQDLITAGLEDRVVNRAINALIAQGRMQESKQGKQLRRVA